MTWAVQKCNIFLADMSHFQIITDHHPLVSILNTQCLNEIENPRLQRLKARLMPYNFTVEWVKGTLNQAPDALSRYSVSDPVVQEAFGEHDHNDTSALSCAEIRTILVPGEDSFRIEALGHSKLISCFPSTLSPFLHAGAWGGNYPARACAARGKVISRGWWCP